MPAFESIPTISANIFERDSFPKDDTSIDMPGDRVEACANLVIASVSIQKLHSLISFCNDGTFQFQPAVKLAATTSLHVQRKLKNISYSAFNEDSFAYKVSLFHNYATKCWCGDQKGAKLIIPPVSPEDEK